MTILKQIKEEDILYLDIETVRCEKELAKNTPLYESWEYKMRYSREAEEKFGEKTLEQLFLEKSPLYAEFGKIVCITIGKIKNGVLNVKTYKNVDERELLIEFINVLTKFTDSNKNLRLAGHGLKGFDLPYLMRRCLINGIELHPYLDTAHLKPWELNFVLDTLELWKSTGFYSASLINIAVAMKIPSPKSDMNGSETSEVFYNEEGGLDRIGRYCEQDVICVAKVIRKLRGEEELKVEIIQDVKIEKTPLLNKIYNSKKITEKDEIKLKEITKEMNEEERKIASNIIKATLPKSKLKI